MSPIISYGTLLEAQAYFDDARLNAEAWDESIEEIRLKALKSATIKIDRLSFKGTQTYIGQVREWPRNGAVLVIDDIKIACFEIALALLDGVDPDLEEEALGSMTDAYATIRITSDPNIRKDHIRAGIPSTEAWKHLLPHLNDPLDLHIRRG